MIAQESCPQRLALTIALGTYVAFSPFPFPFGHTLVALLCGWLFKVNIPFVYGVSCAINNPWTMIPVYMLDYAFGHWLCHSLFSFDFTAFEPQCLQSINCMLQANFGFPSICFWSFFIGGNLLGICTAMVVYFLAKQFFVKGLPVKKISV